MGFIAKALGFLISVFEWLHDRSQREIGKTEQREADLQASVKGAEDAQRINESVKGLSDSDLDKRVADSMRDATGGE